MNVIRHLKYIMVSAALSLSLASCGESGVDGEVEMSCTDIVTFEGNEGDNAVFSFQKVDDSPLITLTSRRTLDYEGLEPGCRMLIRYNPPDNQAYTSGLITLLGAKVITQSALFTEWSADFDGWDNNPVYLYSAWRTGSYLNVHVRLTYSTEPRVFCLAANPETLDSPWVDVYLVHRLPCDTDSFERAYYASFDLSPVWERPEVEGIRLHVANSNLDKHIFTFPRSR